MENKEHWENVYTSKGPTEVSWFQEYPKTAMDCIENLSVPKSGNIIDIGGGDSNLVDVLLERGYENIWVLDISSAALEKAKKLLEERASNVHWIVADITEFVPEVNFDFWYDRAVFHFFDRYNENYKV